MIQEDQINCFFDFSFFPVKGENPLLLDWTARSFRSTYSRRVDRLPPTSDLGTWCNESLNARSGGNDVCRGQPVFRWNSGYWQTPDDTAGRRPIADEMEWDQVLNLRFRNKVK